MFPYLKKSGKPGVSHVAIISGVALLMSVLSGCQNIALHDDRPDDTARSSNEAVTTGQPLEIKDRKSVCQGSVAMKAVKHGRLSPKAKKNLSYDYYTAIQSSIVSQWSKPPHASAGTQCSVRIKQRIDGCVQHVSVVDCPDNDMRKSVTEAVNAASPLPETPHPDLFQDTLQLNFQK